MSGQQSPVAPESSESEAVREPSSAVELNIEDDPRIRASLRAQTGFNSYQAYLEAYMDWEVHTDLMLLRDLMIEVTSPDAEDTCSILDVLTNEGLPPELSFRCHCKSGSEIFDALRQPPMDACVQIVIWRIETTTGLRLSRWFLDILGLCLRIDPQFFLALFETLRGLRRSSSFETAVDTRPLRPSHVVIDHTVATFVRQYPFDRPDTGPIILIAGDHFSGHTESSLLDRYYFPVAHQNINNSPPFTFPSPGVQSTPVFGSLASNDRKWLHMYKETFSAVARNNPGIPSCTAAIIARTLMPLLQMDCLKMRSEFLLLRRTFVLLQAAMNRVNVDLEFVNSISSKLHRERFWLRRSVEDSENSMSHFERYISAEDANYLPESSAYLKIKQETDQIHNEARRLDMEVRDYLQLVVGNLSLEESRKSIEVSNQQILEGKRGLWPHDEDRQTFANQD